MKMRKNLYFGKKVHKKGHLLHLYYKKVLKIPQIDYYLGILTFYKGK